MLDRFVRLLAAGMCVAGVALLNVAAPAQVAVTTWHYDNFRSGANTKETVLNPGNVNQNNFGKLFTQPVDGAIIGQALFLPNVAIPGKGAHNVVYVATMHDSVYAFDADDANGANSTPLWHQSLLPVGAKPVPIKLQGCGGVTKWTEVGIISTPVIDTASGTLYVVAKTYENNTHVHRLHALDVSTGEEKPGSPVVIQGSYTSGGTKYVFKDEMQVNRPALMLQHGYLYIAFGANGCRSSKEQGWVISYKAATLQYAGAFDTEPGSSAGGIWQKGGGLSGDGTGIYGETADGPFTAGKKLGLSVFNLNQGSGTLTLSDWFTPFNVGKLNQNDLDLNDPILILPDQSGPYPHLAIAVGKEGTLYVLNRDNMGHYCTNCVIGDTQIVQELPILVGDETGALVYWNNIIYSSGVSMPIEAYALVDGSLVAVPFALSSPCAGGHSPVLSAQGTSGGILWQINGSALTAYNALTLKKLYTSMQAASRDALPSLPHFANFMVADGKVYVGTNSSLAVYGLY